MSFWSFLGELTLFELLFKSNKQGEVKALPSRRAYDYGREDDYFDKVYSLKNESN